MLPVTPRRIRNRAVYGLAVVVVIALGLASRHFISAFLELFGKYPGDALWAAMIFFGWGALRPRAGTVTVALSALITCVAVEVLKFYQAPWLVGMRHTTLGHLIFGNVFSVQNLVAYAIGVALAVGIEVLCLCPGTSLATELGKEEAAPGEGRMRD